MRKTDIGICLRWFCFGFCFDANVAYVGVF